MDMINSFFSGPTLPATLFLGLLVIWSLLAIVGTVDFDVPSGNSGLDTDLGAELNVDFESATQGPGNGLAVLMMKWLNLRDVPLVLWMGVLAVVWWFFSATLWQLLDSKIFKQPGWFWSSLLVVRNLAIAVPITKLATQPMKGWFHTERLDAQTLIGKECQISSLQANADFGQVKFKTEGSPLLLNVRTDGVSLAQGTHVWITHYDAKRRVYIVSPTTARGSNDPEP